MKSSGANDHTRQKPETSICAIIIKLQDLLCDRNMMPVMKTIFKGGEYKREPFVYIFTSRDFFVIVKNILFREKA